MRVSAAYCFEKGVRNDPAWSVYLDFLYPNERSMETIQNRRTCSVLEQRGDDLSKVRDIDHWAYFPEAAMRDCYISDALAHGFLLRPTSNGVDSDRGFCAILFRPDAPARIDDPVLTLFDCARNVGGQYDGWETQIVG